jgi:FkbM family methyltransferase
LMGTSRLYQRVHNAALELRHFLVLAKRMGFGAAVQLSLRNELRRGELRIRYPGFRNPFILRAGSSDFETFRQILLYSEMEFPVPQPPRRILDAGANLGLATLALLHRFPEAEVIAIEAESRNFEILSRNLAPYPQVTCVHGALWFQPGTVCIDDEDAANWSFKVSDRNARSQVPAKPIRAYTVQELMALRGWDTLDLVKMDIEGAEKDIFDADASWLDAVELLVVETHDRFRPGSRRSVYRATDNFPWEYQAGEKLVFSKSPFAGAKTP